MNLEGDISAMHRQFNSNGPISVEQMHMPTIHRPDLKSFLGDPTPLYAPIFSLGILKLINNSGIMGFILALAPFTCELMESRGAVGAGAATVLSLEIRLSSSFLGPSVCQSCLDFVCSTSHTIVAAFWLSYATTLTPFYNAAIAYDPTNLENPGFYNAYGFFTLFMGILCFMYLICSLRTNLCFVVIFLGLVLGFVLLTGAVWQLANGNQSLARTLKKAAGACLALGSLPGWYFLFVQLLATVDFPLTLPIEDLSHIIPAGSERKKMN
ncbi:unnamed protein product [Penicillium nalgiovense]|uniref:Uncharacterized protein n=1 Tax=Penicillium nalgiovense TaxID=60175 RepID=A0A9W4HJ69_PENNA|nr:unnamed protein product [Penicillium nalgiovense]CAG7990806.1 unnamed protein product [Penicillium nalgiovense]CAG8003027.1 unnamed protein product [Penicillium nalgiovense]CAG8005028.1 unnamed protein product [Penicillium nalgiovense]CAG8025720.1 unnamed protein product [Penicillium nalgiovense]